MNNRIRRHFELVLLSGLATSLCVADSLVVGTNEPVHGTFQSFKGDRIYFQDTNGKKLVEQSAKVFSATLDPPANVDVKPKGKKNIQGMKLKGFEKPNFIFLKGPEEVKMPASQVSTISMELDFRRPTQVVKEVVWDTNETVSVESLVDTNAVTVILFQMKEVTSAARIVNYVKGLAANSHGKIVLKEVDLTSWDSAVAKQYEIKTAPQFWVYNRKGGLVKKVTDYRSTEEIDKVLKEARR